MEIESKQCTSTKQFAIYLNSRGFFVKEGLIKGIYFKEYVHVQTKFKIQIFIFCHSIEGSHDT